MVKIEKLLKEELGECSHKALLLEGLALTLSLSLNHILGIPPQALALTWQIWIFFPSFITFYSWVAPELGLCQIQLVSGVKFPEVN